MSLIKLVYNVVVISILSSVCISTCPHSINSKIQECVQPVAEYAKILNNRDPTTSEFGNTFSLPSMGGRVFNELCRLIAKFNSCVRDFRSTCSRHVTISLIDSSYGYLCNEGYNTFMESAECLMDLDRKPSVKRCHDETLKEIESANTETGISMSAKLDRMCGALNFFSGCVRLPIKQECGFSAWQVIYRVLKDTTNTLMPACQFTGTSNKLTLFQKEQDIIEARNNDKKSRTNFIATGTKTSNHKTIITVTTTTAISTTKTSSTAFNSLSVTQSRDDSKVKVKPDLNFSEHNLKLSKISVNFSSIPFSMYIIFGPICYIIAFLSM